MKMFEILLHYMEIHPHITIFIATPVILSLLFCQSPTLGDRIGNYRLHIMGLGLLLFLIMMPLGCMFDYDISNWWFRLTIICGILGFCNDESM